ncbi:periplasmic heavy metal sensor [Kordiimonas aquimaris]|uniref:periplasmic heavy metal sensor n=1 Tax=Kordiimonas aquimaris TaxID=707591 RepID=UPI0021CEDF94|nr:periplasmic heavy metal sensor [Kordiimonas aquimaris]
MSKQTKWVAIALALSIAVNIFMVGLSLGKNLIGGKQNGRPPHAEGLNARALGRYLSDDERTAMRDLLDGERREIGRSMRRLRQNEEEIRAVFRAEEINQKKLQDLIAEHETLVTESRAKLQRKLFDFMATLDPETRRALADDLFKPPHRRGRGADGRRPPPPHEGDGFGPRRR